MVLTNQGENLDLKVIDSGAAPLDNFQMSAEGLRKMVDSKDGKNLYWTSNINVELPICMNDKDGVSALIRPEVIPYAFMRAVKLRQDWPALFVKR